MRSSCFSWTLALGAVALWVGCTSARDRSSSSLPAHGGAPAPMQAPEMNGPIPPGTAGTGSDMRSAAGTIAAREGRASTGDTALPCGVAEIVETSCQGCHAREPGLFAPMALVTAEDFDAPALGDPDRAVRALVLDRIHDPVRPMPPASSRRLTPDELAALDAFAAGKPAAAPEGCAPPPDTRQPQIAPEPDDIGECYRLQAHDKPVPRDVTPFQVESGEFYSCFYFAVPWPEDSQAVVLRSLDTPLTHHWQLYHTVESHEDGQTTRRAADCGFDLREALGVYSHSEERDQYMPAGVGLQLPPPGQGHGLLLEIHYWNPGEPIADTTGVEICTAKTPRPNSAGVAVLGPAYFTLPPGAETTASGTCTPAYRGDIHVFRSFPHMHARGIAMDTIIVRANGMRETLLDVGFDFNNQVMVDTPAVLQAGDRLITRCHFRNDTDKSIAAGFSADEEMCNHFVYHWPAGVISNGNIGNIAGLCLY